MGPSDYDLMSSLSPEQLQQMLGLGTLDERGDVLQQQLMQAQALRNGKADPHSTGMGAALGGIGNVLDTVTGGMQEKQIAGKQDALLGQKDAGRNAYAQAIVEALKKQQQVPGSAGAADAMPSSMFAMG